MLKIKTPELGKVGLIFACGLALYSDGYINASSGEVNTILTSYIYKGKYDPVKLKQFSSAFSSVAFAGTVFGMLLFGVLSDVIGRKFGMVFACLWLALFSILAAGAWGAGGSTGGLFAALIAYRFLIGIGIGAEYPAGSVAASENTEGDGVSKNRQQALFVLSTNTAIDFGFTLAAFIPLILLWICGTSDGGLTTVWRVTLGLGAVCPLTILFFRARMHEPVAYRKNKIKYNKMPWRLILKRYWVRLSAVCLAWFIYNWVTYPAGIYSSLIIDKVVPNGDLYKTFGWNTLLNAFYIVGTFFGVAFIEVIGPKWCFIVGLICQSAIAFGLAGGYTVIEKNVGGFTVMYGLFLAFGEFGPGNNLGLLASKAVAPTAVRGLFYGIAAAIGKVGAFAGTYAFADIQAGFAKYPNGDILQTTGPFYISGGLALVSASLIFFFIPPVVPDGMKKEDAAFIAYLEEHGYDVRELGILVDDEDEQQQTAAAADVKQSAAAATPDEKKKADVEQGSASSPEEKKESTEGQSTPDEVTATTHELRG